MNIFTILVQGSLALGKHRPGKHIIAWLTAGLLLAACSIACPSPTITPTSQQARPTPTAPVAATSAPTATPTATQSATHPASPTVTRTFAPTRTPTEAPPLAKDLRPVLPATSVSGYRLHPWDERTCLNLVERLRDNNAFGDQNIYGISPYTTVFRAECLLRFPESASREMQLWQMAGTDPHGFGLPGMPTGQDLLAYLVEDWLNNQGGTLDTLATRLEPLYFYIDQPTQVENLFGDGQIATVFKAQATESITSCGLFALHQVENRQKLETIQDWRTCDMMAYYQSYSFNAVGDVNGNGIPELAVQVSTAMGLPASVYMALDLYEWQAAQMRFTVQDIVFFDQDCGLGDWLCEGSWEFGDPDINGVRKLITQSPTYTRYECPEAVTQSVYGWDGKQYTLESESILPPPADPPECRLAWADAVIGKNNWKNDQAISLLAEALDNWAAATGDLWGPASRDYFRLRLGIWLDLRGEGSAALAQLQSLAGQPADPAYDLPSRLATTYLEGRAQQGIVRACVQAEQLWEEERTALEEASGGFPDWETVSQAWGFIDNHRWMSGTYMPNITDLCNPLDALAVVAPTLRIASMQALNTWLEQAGLQVTAIQAGDLDGDGPDDWLVRLIGGRWTGAELWAFVKTPGGLQASRAADVNSSAELAWRAFQPAQGGPWVNIVQTGEGLAAFRITGEGKAESLFSAGEVQSYWIDQQAESSRVALFKHEGGWDTREYLVVYTWEAGEGFKEQKLGYDYQAFESEAKRLVFQTQDFPAAIDYITQALNEAPSETNWGFSCSDETGCQSNGRVWHQPYLRYLLGIAYEMDGQPDQALWVYYGLWSEYPTHLFGLAAASKLAPIR